MKKIIIAIGAMFFWINNSFAVVLFNKSFDEQRARIFASSFYDFEPIAYIEDGKLSTAFDPFLELANDEANLELVKSVGPSVEENIKLVEARRGLFIGCLPRTTIFEDLKIIYPAVLTSPVKIISLPDASISKISELKDLKAGIYKKEIFPDYVKDDMQDYNISFYDSYYQMIEALFNQEIDFVFSNHYYGIVELAKIGISNEVVISKESIWKFPLFMCVSTYSKEHEKIVAFYERILKEENIEKMIKDNLIKTINDIKTKYSGVSAPDFIKERKE